MDALLREGHSRLHASPVKSAAGKFRRTPARRFAVADAENVLPPW